MTITLTTRSILDMMKNAYKIGALEEAIRNPIEENLEGRADIVAKDLFLKHAYKDDYIVQQS
jgi:hypothetical protein